MKILFKQKFLYYFIILIICFACEPFNEISLSDMNGYWEIEKVKMKDGTEKKYTYSKSIDFIEINDSTGIRKKLQPQLKGTFIKSSNAEIFNVKFENDSLRTYYKTSLSKWKETIITLNKNQMIIKNALGILYFYKKYEKLNVE